MSQQGSQSNPWKWIAIALAVVLIGGPCLCIGGSTLLGGLAVGSAMSQAEPIMKPSMAIATDADLKAHLGEPIEMKQHKGTFELSEDGEGDGVADFTFEVIGSKEKGVVTVKGSKTGEADWVYERMAMDTEKDGEPAVYDFLTNSWE
jgi:hypothetical protein